MKKILCLLLVLIMLVSLCGCFGDTKPENGTGDVNSSTGTENGTGDKDEEKEPEFSLGTVTGQTYSSSFLGLSCTLPAEWTYYTEQQLREMNNINEDLFDEEFVEQLKKATVIYDMYASYQAEGSSININMEKLNALQLVTLDIKKVLESQIDTIVSAYGNMGYTDTKAVYQKVTVDGKEFDSLKITAKIQGIDFYGTVFAFRKGEYLANVSLGTILTDKTETFLSWFTVA